jgi:hypothetical protein
VMGLDAADAFMNASSRSLCFGRVFIWPTWGVAVAAVDWAGSGPAGQVVSEAGVEQCACGCSGWR